MTIEKNGLEWAVFAVSVVLIGSVLGYLVYDSFDSETPSPVITIELGEVIQREEHFLVPVEITNQGDRSAESVLVEVALMRGEEEIETAELEVAFAPRHSTREGWVAFTTDPATASLQARIVGYQEP